LITSLTIINTLMRKPPLILFIKKQGPGIFTVSSG
jgi:hypothetical protein